MVRGVGQAACGRDYQARNRFGFLRCRLALCVHSKENIDDLANPNRR